MVDLSFSTSGATTITHFALVTNVVGVRHILGRDQGIVTMLGSGLGSWVSSILGVLKAT
jgi:hypothetical protein